MKQEIKQEIKQNSEDNSEDNSEEKSYTIRPLIQMETLKSIEDSEIKSEIDSEKISEFLTNNKITELVNTKRGISLKPKRYKELQDLIFKMVFPSYFIPLTQRTKNPTKKLNTFVNKLDLNGVSDEVKQKLEELQKLTNQNI